MAEIYLKNINPCKRMTGDCVYRAFALFLDISWIQAVFDLVSWCAERGKVDFTMRNSIKSFLGYRGYTRYRVPRKGMTVAEFVDEYAEDGKKYILSCPRHLTVVMPWWGAECPGVTHVVVDSWDCRGKTVDGYWERTVDSDLVKGK